MKNRDIALPTKVHIVKSVVFSSGHVWMWELDHKKSWAPKNWCFWTVVLEKTLESPLDYTEIKSVSPKENQSWIFIGRTNAETEAPILWPPDVKNWLIRKDPDAGKDWRQEEKGTTEDEMVGWHHWFDGHEFKQTPESKVMDKKAWCAAVLWSQIIRYGWVTKKTELMKIIQIFIQKFTHTQITLVTEVSLKIHTLCSHYYKVINV